jgi:hypothetical protein
MPTQMPSGALGNTSDPLSKARLAIETSFVRPVHLESQIPLWVKEFHPEFYYNITSKENWCYTNIFKLPDPIIVTGPTPDPLPTPGPPLPFDQPGLFWYKRLFANLATRMNEWKGATAGVHNDTDYQSIVMDIVNLTVGVYIQAKMYDMDVAPNPYGGQSVSEVLANSDIYKLLNMSSFIPVTLNRNLPIANTAELHRIEPIDANTASLWPYEHWGQNSDWKKYPRLRGDDWYNDIDLNGNSALLAYDTAQIFCTKDTALMEVQKAILLLAIKTLGVKTKFENPINPPPTNDEKNKKIFVDLHYEKAYKTLNIHGHVHSVVPTMEIGRTIGVQLTG